MSIAFNDSLKILSMNWCSTWFTKFTGYELINYFYITAIFLLLYTYMPGFIQIIVDHHVSQCILCKYIVSVIFVRLPIRPSQIVSAPLLKTAWRFFYKTFRSDVQIIKLMCTLEDQMLSLPFCVGSISPRQSEAFHITLGQVFTPWSSCAEPICLDHSKSLFIKCLS